jgi:hypothetical protein
VNFLTDHGAAELQCTARDGETMAQWIADNLETNKFRVIWADEIQKCKGGKDSPWEVMKEAWEGNGEEIPLTVMLESKTDSGVVMTPKTITYRPSKTIWILSTNKEPKDEAFVRRCLMLALRPYGPKGMAHILTCHARERGLTSLIETKSAIDCLVRNCRPNGGASETLMDAIRLQMPHYTGNTVLTSETGERVARYKEADVKNLLVLAKHGPNGWTDGHIALLEAAERAHAGNKRPTLADYGEGALEGRGDSAAARLVRELIGAGYMVTGGTGKGITPQGKEFLQAFRLWAKAQGVNFSNTNA